MKIPSAGGTGRPNDYSKVSPSPNMCSFTCRQSKADRYFPVILHTYIVLLLLWITDGNLESTYVEM